LDVRRRKHVICQWRDDFSEFFRKLGLQDVLESECRSDKCRWATEDFIGHSGDVQNRNSKLRKHGPQFLWNIKDFMQCPRLIQGNRPL
jgi:hypothetical protein